MKTERKKTFALKKISAFGALKISLECRDLMSVLLLPRCRAATLWLPLFYGHNQASQLITARNFALLAGWMLTLETLI